MIELRNETGLFIIAILFSVCYYVEYHSPWAGSLGIKEDTSYEERLFRRYRITDSFTAQQRHTICLVGTVFMWAFAFGYCTFFRLMKGNPVGPNLAELCPKCGKPCTDNNSEYCPHCGRHISSLPGVHWD
jgi:hypothetical protein